MSSQGEIQARMGNDLEQIETEGLGFSALAGDSKVRLVPTPWPADALPSPTSSLLSIASSKGLIAAAGPDAVILATTASVRAAFSAKTSEDTSNKAFQPQLTIPLPRRVSHVAFSADDSCLAISAEEGGGLAIYDVQAMLQGNTQPAFEMSTNGSSLRAMIPNPAPETSEHFAVITTNGELMMANLKQRQFLSAANGQVLKDGVSCVSWSPRGRQLVAGLGNGTTCQMTREGKEVAEIPAPQGLEGDQHVSSISWLQNNIFLLVHTPTTFDLNSIPTSTFHLVTQIPKSPVYVFNKLADPCPPSGLNRSPPFHFILRMKGFEPHLQDLLIISSTGATDIGLITRSETPLTSEYPAESITNAFTTTGMANDARRAQLPMTGDFNETSPIGMGIDLSSQDLVDRPIPGEEIDKSSTPLPALMVMNNEGILVAWWIVYSESVREGKPYHGIAGLGSNHLEQQHGNSQQSTPITTAGLPQGPKLGQEGPGSTVSSGNPFNAINKPAASAFGSPAFGTPAFGNSGPGSGFGRPPSVWGTPSTPAQSSFGAAPTTAPTFGSSTALGSGTGGNAFGNTSGLGNRTSPWSTAGSNNTFAKGPGFDSKSSTVPGAAPGGSGGFGAYANKGGFGVASPPVPKEGLFAKQGNVASFGSGMDTVSSFGRSELKDDRNEAGGSLGRGGGFNLGSTFKGDGSARDDGPRPVVDSEKLFGSGFGDSLQEISKSSRTPDTRDADMEEGSEENHVPSGIRAPTQSTNPSTTSAPPESQFPGLAEGTKNDFLNISEQAKPTGANQKPDVPNLGESSSQPDSQTKTAGQFEPSQTSAPLPPSPKIKAETEVGEQHDVPQRIDDEIAQAPVPPESTSKTSFAPGDSSASSTSTNKIIPDDAPLPPDFVPTERVPATSNEENDESLPVGEGSGLDEEGSGVDVAQDLSPASDHSRSIKATPQSSFGDSFNRSPVGGLFTHVERSENRPASRPLFGELSNKNVPNFPPPARVQQSPRSPSPVRRNLPDSLLKPGNSRSVSAPGAPPQSGTAKRSHQIYQGQAGDRLRRQDHILEEDKRRSEELNTRRRAEEEQDLSDREDERVREELSSEVESTLRLDPFIAHQDYVGHIDKPGVPGQIERVYRDINSMIDTLGLNARSLKAFIQGHSEQYPEGGRTREDLESDDDWCLIEIEDLSIVENELGEQLQNGRVTEIPERTALCKDIQKGLSKVRGKQNDIKSILDTRNEPAQVAAIRSSPLSNEQALQQHDIRKAFTESQRLLAELEEGVSLLNAKLVSSNEVNGKTSKRSTPTVEAVINTIMKMTTMIEKRSGDVDVLENHLRKLRLDSVDHATSQEASPVSTPVSTPQSSRSKAIRPHGSSTFGLFYTPDSLQSTPHGLDASARRSVGRSGFRKSSNGVSAESMARTGAARAKKIEITNKLRESLNKNGPRISKMDE
ncbi:MAG: hypothetical protein M1837_002971 [Sclerophora amabilis]|nr:MAG: hypothetical protein M1837_002971 [Sclerophora amabilis]